MGGRATGDATGFGVALKAHREAAGLSQQQLADRAGMNLWGVAKLEQGQREPGWATVLALADALGLTPNDFRPATDGKRPGAARGRRSDFTRCWHVGGRAGSP